MIHRAWMQSKTVRSIHIPMNHSACSLSHYKTYYIRKEDFQMPFINMKTTATLDIAKKDALSKELCIITRDCIGKGENWVMTGFEGNASLCFLGSTKDIAYVEVKCYGYPTKPQMNLMTRKVCTLLENELGIPKKRIYVAYFPTEDWGWNDSNF